MFNKDLYLAAHTKSGDIANSIKIELGAVQISDDAFFEKFETPPSALRAPPEGPLPPQLRGQRGCLDRHCPGPGPLPSFRFGLNGVWRPSLRTRQQNSQIHMIIIIR